MSTDIRIEEIAAAARLREDPEERTAFIAAACENRSSMMMQVKTAMTRTQLDNSNGDEGESISKPGQLSPGDKIGVYTIMGKLGDGGFGEVYQAQQNQPVQRRVAIKVIKKGMDSEQVLARFESERQSLAMIEHPGVAKVFDAGTTQAGQPFFVMELVNGIPITRFCDMHKYSVRKRIEVLIQVCRAIQHAHLKGIIHRDIKPSNVLVSPSDGEAKAMVIDFGIAKATHNSGRCIQTKVDQVLGTPAYMSPEQAEAQLDIDTRSDIYSLGVVLYELLCGTLPFEHSDHGTRREELLRAHHENDAPRPSRKFTRHDKTTAKRVIVRNERNASSMKRALSGELDWIAVKCLEFDRNDRYETVNDLAKDLKRFLSGEPVQARQNSALYSFRKFALRHGRVMAVFLGAILVLSLLFKGWYDRYQASKFVTAMYDFWSMESLTGERDQLLGVPPDERRDRVDRWLSRGESVMEHLERDRSLLSQDKSLGNDRTIQELLGKLELFAGQDGLYEETMTWAERCPDQAELKRRWNEFRTYVKEYHPTWSVFPDAKLCPIGQVGKYWHFVDLGTGLLPPQQGKIDRYTGVEYVLLPGGKFKMGSEPGEVTDTEKAAAEKQHDVYVSPFMISVYETTQAQAANSRQVRPVDLDPLKPFNATWFEAYDLAVSMGSTLPTEAQWEYACRAGQHGSYSGDGELENMGWYRGNNNGGINGVLQVVGLKRSNQFGLYDMHGNALEWVLDRWDARFYESVEGGKPDPVCLPEYYDFSEWKAAGEPTEGVLRGGPCNGLPEYCRSADRYHLLKNDGNFSHGLRTVITSVIVVDKAPGISNIANE